MSKITIRVDCGVVTEVYSTNANDEIKVIDFDGDDEKLEAEAYQIYNGLAKDLLNGKVHKIYG